MVDNCLYLNRQGLGRTICTTSLQRPSCYNAKQNNMLTVPKQEYSASWAVLNKIK